MTRYSTARTRKGAGLCPTCHDHELAGQLCRNCRRHHHTLEVDQLAPVTVLASHTRSDPIRNDLHNYKTAGHPIQADARNRLAALLEPALNTYTRLGAIIVPVPSTRTPKQSPLSNLIKKTGHHPSPLIAATRRRPGRTATTDLFEVAHTPEPSRPILLVEDTYVTGATAQSAAHTLQHTNPVTILTIGRRYRPPNRSARYPREGAHSLLVSRLSLAVVPA